MNRTTKILKTHFSCVCGFNSADQYETDYTYKELRALGYKAKKFKDGTRYWFRSQVNEICEDKNAHYEEDIF